MKAFLRSHFLLLLCLLSAVHSESTNPSKHVETRINTELSATGRHLNTFDTICPDGTVASTYRCGCDVLSAAEHATVQRVSTNGALNCQAICGQDDASGCAETPPDQDCSQYVCVQNNCGAIGLHGSDINIIRGGCVFDENSGWYVCDGGYTTSQQTYTSVSGGACAPVCGQPQLSCQFPAQTGPTIFLDEKIKNETEVVDEEPEVASNCQEGDEPTGYICGCQPVSITQKANLEQTLLGQNSGCVPVCGAVDDIIPLFSECKKRTCQNDVCIGPRNDVQCAAFVDQRISKAINTYDCSPNSAANTVMCVNGDNFVEVDQPSYNTIQQGVCISACDYDPAITRCRFNPIVTRSYITEEEEAAPSSEGPDETVESSIAPPSDESVESSVAPPSVETLESSVAPPSLEIESSVAPPSFEIESSVAPPSFEIESSVAPPSFEIESSVAPPSDDFLESSIAPPSDDFMESSVAPPSDDLMESSIAPPSDEFIESSESPPSSEAPPSSEEALGSGSETEPTCEELIKMMKDIPDFGFDIDDDLFDTLLDLPDRCLPPSAPPSASEIEPEEPDLGPEVYGSDEAIESYIEIDFGSEMEPETLDSVEPPESEISSEIAPASESLPELREIDPGAPVNPQNRVKATGWSECSQKCKQASSGEVTKKRTVLCVNAYGIPLPADQCREKDFDQYDSSESCESELEDCSGGFYIVLGDWTGCSANCSTYDTKLGEYIPGTQKRPVTCYNDNKDEVDIENCDALLEDVITEQNCSAIPCEIVSYSKSKWSNCGCDGVRTRNVTCVNTFDEEKDPALCEAARISPPKTNDSCTPTKRCDQTFRKLLQQRPSQQCKNLPCSTKGGCNNGICECDEGFDGPDCQLDKRSDPTCPPNGVFGPDGKCCESGVFSYDGVCCKGDNSKVQLDINGECCDQGLDFCGICGGTGTPDAIGRCCTTQLDGNGICCESDAIDECGICDGDGSSCNLEITIEMSATEKRIMKCDDLIADFFREILDINKNANVTRVSIGKVGNGRKQIRYVIPSVPKVIDAVSAAFAMEATNFILDNPQCNFNNFVPTKQPVCGNGLCEVGETPSNINEDKDLECPQDCKFNFDWCDLTVGFDGSSLPCRGHGTCSFANVANCECFEGYSGDQCQSCSSGFDTLFDGDTRCFPRQNYETISKELETPPDESAEGPSSGDEDKGKDRAGLGDEEPGAEGPEAEGPDDGSGNVSRQSPKGVVFTINNSTEKDSEANFYLIVPLAIIFPFILLLVLLAIYLAKKRSRESKDKGGEDSQKQSLAKGAYLSPRAQGGPPPTTNAKTLSSVWKHFFQNLAPSITTSTHPTRLDSGNRGYHDSPTRYRGRVEEEGSDTSDVVIHHASEVGTGTRGIPGPVIRGIIASPSSANPNIERKPYLTDTKKWDVHQQSMKRSTELQDEDVYGGPSRRTVHSRDSENILPIDEGDDVEIEKLSMEPQDATECGTATSHSYTSDAE